MTEAHSLTIAKTVADALARRQPVVALESTVVSHGLPWPANYETARAIEETIRAEGAVPATIGVCNGRLSIGLSETQLRVLAQHDNIFKAGRRDLAVAVSQGLNAATTVSATMYLAHRAGIRLFATGGIGGAHRRLEQSWDISADLMELSRTPVAVVCAGAKSILDIPRTLEILETHAVPVLGYQTDTFPAFYLATSGLPVSARVDSTKETAALLLAHWELHGKGIVIAQPIASEAAVDAADFQKALAKVEREATRQEIRGKDLTPFLLAGLAQETAGRSVLANQKLLLANARLAAQISTIICRQPSSD